MAFPSRPGARRPFSPIVPAGYQITAHVREVVVPLILVYAILLPAGLALELGGIVLPPYRIAILATLPLAIIQMFRRKQPLTLPDGLIIAGSLWGFIAMIMSSGLDEGLEAGGSFAVDVLGSYMIGRAYITDVRKLRTLLIVALPGILAIALILAFEAISHRLLIAPLFPYRASLENLYETRLGLLRARAVFPHSIAAGLFMGSLLSLYFMSRIMPKLRLAGALAAMAALFSGSSAAYVIIAIIAGLIAYKAFFNVILHKPERLSYLVYAGIAGYIVIELLTGRGAVRTLINLLAINRSSGYYRLLIWEYGTASVERNPWFGIGNAPMPRPDWMVMETIDNHWLALAVRFGLPTSLLFGVGVCAAVWHCVMRNERLNEFDRATTLGAVFALIALSIVAWTVGLWANHVAWYMLLVGSVAALACQLPVRPTRPVARHGAMPRAARGPALGENGPRRAPSPHQRAPGRP